MIRLVLPLPPSANTLYRTYQGRMVKSPAHVAYSEFVGVAWHNTYPDGLNHTMTPPFKITMLFVYADRRKHDGDNMQKCLWDSLSRVLGFDDSAFVEWHGSKRYEAEGKARCEIEIEEATHGRE